MPAKLLKNENTKPATTFTRNQQHDGAGSLLAGPSNSDFVWSCDFIFVAIATLSDIWRFSFWFAKPLTILTRNGVLDEQEACTCGGILAVVTAVAQSLVWHLRDFLAPAEGESYIPDSLHSCTYLLIDYSWGYAKSSTCHVNICVAVSLPGWSVCFAAYGQFELNENGTTSSPISASTR